MEISVNNKSVSINEGSNLQALVNSHIGEKQKGVAIAVNENVIPKTEWEQHIIKANDNILIIKATQGG